MRNVSIIIVSLLICGCSKYPAKNTPPKKTSSTQILIEGMTGHTAIKSGKKAAYRLKKINASQQKKLNEILEQ